MNSEPIGGLHSALVVDMAQPNAAARCHCEYVAVFVQPRELGDGLV
jgi:hypothetical protein